MTFIWPIMLVCLLLIPLFAFLYMRGQQRRRQMLAGFAAPIEAQGAHTGRPGARRHVPPLLFLLALMILVMSLARPQALVNLPRLEGTVILAFDVSNSMQADDLKPTRLDAAKAAARDFVQRQPAGVQIGVVSFSDAGFTTQPPSADQGAVLSAINRLSLQHGTSLAHGIEASLNVIAAGTNPPLSLSTGRTPTPTPTPVPPGTYKPSVIILLTDGENNEDPDPQQVAQLAADRGIRIYTVGVGSSAGATLHINGFTVQSRLDEATLQQISQITGGTYQNAQTTADLQTIYDNLNPELVIKPQQTEITSIFAGAGILLMLIGGTLSLLWLGRLP